MGIFTRGVVDWCNNLQTSSNILLMHHPLSDLIQWSKEALRQLIENNFSLCLCGHNHEQDVFFNKISNRSLVHLAPQVFTSKSDLLGYGIILVDNNNIDKVHYREYAKGQFFNGHSFSENDEGIVSIQSSYLKSVESLKDQLRNALSFFKNQPEVFIEPKISKEREFNNEPNLLQPLIREPKPSIIISHPQFGLTCLSHYMRLEAFSMNNFWIYIDSKHVKARQIKVSIDSQLKEFSKKEDDIKCIIIDSWDASVIDHRTMLKNIDNDYRGVPIIVMSNYSSFNYELNFAFSDLYSELEVLHLQAMQRNQVREFVSKYTKEKNITREDAIVEKVVKDLEALNIHRTPFNCLTLLKVLERNYDETLVNRTKMIKAVLFILFTDADSFAYSTNKPDVEDCEYALGKFCKKIIEDGIRNFSETELRTELESYCKERMVNIDLKLMIDILESNNILLRFRDNLEFKHSYWIYYFAANYMLHDPEFKDKILRDKNYVNFPEVIEFYTGIDGRRNDAIEILLNDLQELNKTVHDRIGIADDFNPFENVIWHPSETTIEAIRQDISEKIKTSKLPTAIKDQYADQHYNSEAPCDQSIRTFLNEYSVVSLIQSIKASSRALRNSNYVDPELKKQMIRGISSGWEQISRVLFWLSPILAQNGFVIYDGLHVQLVGKFEGSLSKRLESIFHTNPLNTVVHFKDDLSSMKIGPLVFDCLDDNKSVLQKHLLSLFLIKERPIGWGTELFTFMNLLHRNSFILGNLCDSIQDEIDKGFVSEADLKDLRLLLKVVAAKHHLAARVKLSEIPKDMTVNEENRLPIDMILSIDKILSENKKRKSLSGKG